MPPKKAATAKATTSPSSETKGETTLQEKNPDAGSTAAASSRKVATHPSMMTMVKEALKEQDTRKGVSTHAIRSYIMLKYPSVDMIRCKYLLRKALVKGVESGVLVRPVNSQQTKGAQGRFRLAPKKAKATKSKTNENTDPNAEPEVTKAGEDKPKMEKDGTGPEKKASVKKRKETPSEESKPASKPKEKAAPVPKAASAPKVAPAKKPKAKKIEEDGEKAAATGKPAPKATKASEGKAAKGSQKKKGEDQAPAKGKQGKKTEK